MLVPTDGSYLDFFGRAVCVDGDTAMICAHRDDDNGSMSGSVYVFSRNGGSWSQQQKLLANDGDGHDAFGWSISIEGNTAVVGTFHGGDHGYDSGSAYVFARSSRTGWLWAEQAKLLPADGAAEDRFGYSVSVDGDITIIGANREAYSDPRGSAHVFTRSGETWTRQHRFESQACAAEQYMGISVAVSGGTAVIGAFDYEHTHTGVGSAYLFELRCDDACRADMNGDGLLDLADVVEFVTAFEAGCP